MNQSDFKTECVTLNANVKLKAQTKEPTKALKTRNQNQTCQSSVCHQQSFQSRVFVCANALGSRGWFRKQESMYNDIVKGSTRKSLWLQKRKTASSTFSKNIARS